MKRKPAIAIEHNQYERLKEISQETDVPITALVKRAIEQYLAQQEKAQ